MGTTDTQPGCKGRPAPLGQLLGACAVFGLGFEPVDIDAGGLSGTRADCPVCAQRVLHLREEREADGPVTMFCAGGCRRQHLEAAFRDGVPPAP